MASIKNLKILKYDKVLKKKTLVFSIICNKREIEDEKIFNEEESIEILKLLNLFKKISLLY